MEAFETILMEIQDFVISKPGYGVVLGADLNAKLNGATDFHYIGEQIPRASMTHLEWNRAKAVHGFASALDLVVTNTWMNACAEEELYTRTNWDQSGSAQIDFVLTSSALAVCDVRVQAYDWFSSDHRAVICQWENLDKPPRQHKEQNKRCIRSWKPAPSWQSEARKKLTDWGDWDVAAERLRATAGDCQLLQDRAPDLELTALLIRRDSQVFTKEEKNKLNRKIWRRRRYLKRSKHLDEIAQDVEAGRAPRKPPSKHYNWGKIAGKTDPKQLLTEFYKELYGLPETEKRNIHDERQHWIDTWRSLQIDIGTEMVTRQKLDQALKKLKKSKGSPDGITAEMLLALPDESKNRLAADISHRCRSLTFPQEWMKSMTTLAPKVYGATKLANFRPIAGLCAMRKLLGYLWILSLPILTFLTLQTAFIPGSHADTGVFMLNRAAELSREWRIPLVLAQLDLKKAFDHVNHKAAFTAMKLQGISLEGIALIAAIWQTSVVLVRLGQVSSEEIPMDRGLPQGAPESPLIFTMIMEMIIRSLEPEWKARGYGFSLDEFRMTCVCYADDIVLAATTREDLESMIADVITALNGIGLGIGAEKTHWTSTPPLKNEDITVCERKVPWEETLTFVGTVLDLRGSAWAAMTYRMAQANKALAKWKPLLTCPWIPRARRVQMLAKTVWPSFLWGSSTWTLTKDQRTKISSWSARSAARVARLRRAPGQLDDQWWRLMHKTGHKLIEKSHIDLVKLCRLRLHGWAGHIARMQPTAPAAQALRCRGLQWWRWRQQQHKLTKNKWTGPHPRRYKLYRWEEQLAQHYGEGYSEDIASNTGWLLTAQDRERWRERSASF